jgi:DUF4097 and DUF4098 domain-containing protein YvlB
MGIATLLLLPGVLQWAHAAPATTVERRVAAEPGGAVTVSDVAGRVQVTGWDRPEVQVTGKLGSGVERLDVLRQGNRVEVKVILPRFSLPTRSGEAELQVQVPRASSLEVATVSADVSVGGVQGELEFRSVSGDIAAGLGSSPVEIKSVSGDVTLRGAGRPGKLRVSTVSGDLKLEQVAGSLEVISVSGDVRARLGAMTSLRVRTTSGDMNLAAGFDRGASFDLESVSGDVQVAAPGPVGFALEAESFSGDVSSCFGARATRDRDGAPNSRLEATRGDGSGRLRIKTMSGDVQVCDR